MRALSSWMFSLVMVSAACGPAGRNGVAGSPDMSLEGSNPLPSVPGDVNADNDADGYSYAQGDCNDSDPLVNPGAAEVAGNKIDDNCNGVVDEDSTACDDGTLVGKTDGPSLAQALGLCDFVESASFTGPSNVKARAILPKFGILPTQQGKTMILLSNGIAADKNSPNFSDPEEGTDFSNMYVNPEPKLVAAADCGSKQPTEVHDYTEFVLKMKAPTNAKSFSFQFQFFSAEYPEFVCTEFNDEFLVEMESANEYATRTNISFDMMKNPVTVNNGFFSVCKNSAGNAHTQNCTKPVSQIAETGYGDNEQGGSTGWLQTTAPVTPGEEFVLHFIIFDEGDGILDSAALIDNFQWSLNGSTGPSTTIF